MTPYRFMRQELEKLAEDVEAPRPSILRRAAPVAAGLGAGALLSAGGLIAARPALRAHFLSDIRSIGRGGGHAVERAQPIPEEARTLAKNVANKLRELGIDPKRHTVAISATGGTGKSTLAKGLHDELQLAGGIHNLDDNGRTLSGRDLSKYVRDNPVVPGGLYEQTHLTRQVDPENFDYVLHLEKPWQDIESQILNRGRGAAQIEAYDYPKLQKNIRAAFDTLGGEHHEVAPGVFLKAKPKEGWGAAERLSSELQQRGIDPTGLSREHQILSLTEGKRLTGHGMLPFLRKKRLAAGAGIVGAGAAGGAVGGKLLGDRLAPEEA
jgi:hypothetical protein